MNQAEQKMSVGPSGSGQGTAPEHRVRYGRVDVAVWKRQGEGRPRFNVSVSRSYKGQDEQWRRTMSLDEEDLLAAAKALEEAYLWIQQERRRSKDDALTFEELFPPSTAMDF
jgi:hypothetical protein